MCPLTLSGYNYYENVHTVIFPEPLSITSDEKTFILFLSSNSEADAWELLEYRKTILSRYYMDSDITIRFKFLTTHWSVARREGFKDNIMI